MSVASNPSLMEQIARQLGKAPSYARGASGSILSAAAASYGSNSVREDLTQPTGFDPEVAALFEALIESAFLVAHADGEFDEMEQQTFEHVVLEVCGGQVSQKQLQALLADLKAELAEDGLSKRVQMVGRSVKRPEHALEVLRVAALLAAVSGGVSEQERSLLRDLALACRLGDDAVLGALAEVRRVTGR